MRATASVMDWMRTTVHLRPLGPGKRIETPNEPKGTKRVMAYHRIGQSSKFIYRLEPKDGGDCLAIATLRGSHRPVFEHNYVIYTPEQAREHDPDWITTKVEDPTVAQRADPLEGDPFRVVGFSDVREKPGGGLEVKLSRCRLYGDPQSDEPMYFGPKTTIVAPRDLIQFGLLRIGPHGHLPSCDMAKELALINNDDPAAPYTGVIEYTDNAPGRDSAAHVAFVVIEDGQIVRAEEFRTAQMERATHVSTGGPAHKIGHTDTGEDLYLQVYNRRRHLGYFVDGALTHQWGGTYMTYRLENGRPHPRSIYAHDGFILTAPEDAPMLGNQSINFVSFTEPYDNDTKLRVFSHVGDLYPMITEFAIEFVRY